MEIPKRKSQKLIIEIQKWIKQLEELSKIQNKLANELLEQIELILIENQDGKAKIAEKIEDCIFDFEDKITELHTVIEEIGGIEREIVNVDLLLNEISDEQKILEAFKISTKNLVKSTLDTKSDMQKNIRNEINQIKEAYKLKREQITKSIENVNLELSSNLKKVEFI
ncbi:MAG: hypothetical protein ACTSO9_19795 [Candidatus Helarchaeota archaeon]